MKETKCYLESRFFSAAFGLIIIAVGLVWFLQIVGLLPNEIKALNYVLPLCVILVGARILIGQTVKENDSK